MSGEIFKGKYAVTATDTISPVDRYLHTENAHDEHSPELTRRVEAARAAASAPKPTRHARRPEHLGGRPKHKHVG